MHTQATGGDGDVSHNTEVKLEPAYLDHFAYLAGLAQQIFRAASEGRVEDIRRLVEQGGDAQAHEQEYGWTALHGAAQLGHAKVVKVLVELGADVHAHKKDGWTALHHAASGGRVEAIKVYVRL